jgi:hypothetical protein
MQRPLLALALIATASVAYAQTAPQPGYAQPQPQPGYAQPQPSNAQPQPGYVQPRPGYAQTAPTNEPRDPYGKPLIGRNDWVAQPGDRINAGAAPPVNARMNARMNSDMAQGPSQAMPMQSGPRQATFKDEYGFRYDAQGNRLDARGNIISPQTR